MISNRAKENHGVSIEIMIYQKNHALASRFALAARSFSHATSVPGWGG
ncbi:hypothetical protein [Planktothrix pseudagardhii]